MTTNQPNSRLDQIEAILLQTAQQQQVNTVAIAELRGSITDNKEYIDALTIAVSGLERDVQITNQAIQQLTDNVNTVTQRVDILAEQAAADRQQAAIDRQTSLAEIQRIWQYLLDRNPGNGRSGE